MDLTAIGTAEFMFAQIHDNSPHLVSAPSGPGDDIGEG